ncbi:hypothetical protein [Microbacterium sp.]|uniref:hypothetical protein n=1 Tax=Microbacterium sp. TaxID=51671 RepID=UPI003A8D7688
MLLVVMVRLLAATAHRVVMVNAVKVVTKGVMVRHRAAMVTVVKVVTRDVMAQLLVVTVPHLAAIATAAPTLGTRRAGVDSPSAAVQVANGLIGRPMTVRASTTRRFLTMSPAETLRVLRATS